MTVQYILIFAGLLAFWMLNSLWKRRKRRQISDLTRYRILRSIAKRHAWSKRERGEDFSVDHVLSKQEKIKQAAKKIYERQKTIYSSYPDLREVSPEQFQNLDLDFYRNLELELRERGFRFIADLEYVNLTALIPDMRSFMRFMVNDDGTICAAFQHLEPGGQIKESQAAGRMPPLRGRTLEFSSEFSDGAFLDTLNTDASRLLRETPGIERILCPVETTPGALLETHRTRLKERIQACPQVQPISMSTLADIKASIYRCQRKKNLHRQETGYITRDEWMGLFLPHRNCFPVLLENAELVMDEIEKLSAEDK